MPKELEESKDSYKNKTQVYDRKKSVEGTKEPAKS